MAYTNTIMNQVLKFIPRHDFQSCVNAFRGDTHKHQLTSWGQFVHMLYAQVTQRKSLRDLASNFKIQAKSLYHWGAKQVHFSTVARANEKRNYEIYETFFHKLYKKILTLPRSHGLRFKNPLYALDATTIDLCLSLFSWAPFRGLKAGIKLNTLLNLSGNIPEFVSIKPAQIHEKHFAYELNLEKGSIVTFDRGYEDNNMYACLDSQGIYFVTRIKKRRIFQVIERRKVNKDKGLIADQTISFTGFYAQRDYPGQLRRIIFKDPETKKRLVYITNIFHLSAYTITQIYKARWQVELFFRWIKQNLKIKSFYGTSENAVKTQIWIAMIAYLVIYWIKHMSKSVLSMMQITRLLQLNLTAKVHLADLLKTNFKLSKTGPPNFQLSFGGL